MAKPIIFATPTGYKIVDPVTQTILSHVGSKKEIQEHKKLGFGVTKSKNKNEKIDIKKLKKEIEAEIRAKIKAEENNEPIDKQTNLGGN